MIRHLFIVLFLVPTILIAQNKIIVVRNQMNKPLSGCTIFKQSVVIGVTDSNGLFSLNSSQNELLIFKALGYKTKIISFNQIYKDVIMFDSIVELEEVKIKPKQLVQTIVGNGFKDRYNYTYMIHSGGFMGTKIMFPRKVFYINELSFLVNNFNLPSENNNLSVKICECPKDTKHDTVGRKIYVDPIVIKLDKKGEWYKLKIDTINQYQINSNCIFVEFEMLYKPNPKEKSEFKYTIDFGLTPKSNGVTTYTHATFMPNYQGFRPEWSLVHTPQKINVKLTVVDEVVRENNNKVKRNRKAISK